MSGAVGLEYLGSEPRPARPWVRGLVAGLVVLTVAAVVLLWWSDLVQRSALQALSTGYERADRVAADGERDVQAMLAYASPAIWSSTVPEDRRAELWALVQGSAAEVSAELSAVRAGVESTTLLPWQEQERVAQREVLALIDAQQARFDGIAADASTVDLVLAGGPLPTGAAASALRAAGAPVR